MLFVRTPKTVNPLCWTCSVPPRAGCPHPCCRPAVVLGELPKVVVVASLSFLSMTTNPRVINTSSGLFFLFCFSATFANISTNQPGTCVRDCVIACVRACVRVFVRACVYVGVQLPPLPPSVKLRESITCYTRNHYPARVHREEGGGVRHARERTPVLLGWYALHPSILTVSVDCSMSKPALV